MITRAGTIVDASIVEVPRQRNSREENRLIMAGQRPEAWQTNPDKLWQKDVDARWTKKNLENHSGYKNHGRADADSALITDHVVTPASVHDSQELATLIGPPQAGENLFADSADASAATDRTLAELGINNYVHEKGARNRPLTETKKGLNQVKSQVRCLVEHVFGCV